MNENTVDMLIWSSKGGRSESVALPLGDTPMAVNGVYYSTLFGKKQAILMRLAKIEKVFVCQKVTKRLPMEKIVARRF